MCAQLTAGTGMQRGGGALRAPAAARVALRASPFNPLPLRRPAGVACRVLTESAQLAPGTRAPDFALPEPLTGKTWTLAQVAEGRKAVLVTFVCVHCPFVVHLKDAFAELAADYAAKGVGVVAISSNSVVTHPQDGPEFIAKEAKDKGYVFPYLYDETQDVARAYKVACTPEFYVFDSSLGLVYHGQFDDSRPNSGVPVTGKDLRAALDAVLAGAPVPKAKPSIGCNLKWAPGKEPEWFGPQQVRK